MAGTAPDLANGFILHAEDCDNAWITEIQAVLIEHRDAPRILYLAHECRKERVPFSKGPLGGGRDIFMCDKPYDFLTYTVAGQFWEIPHADTLVPPQALQGLDVVDVQGSLFLLPARPSGQARVDCPPVPVAFLSWTEVRDRLGAGRLPPRRLFCRFAWTEDGICRELFFPARYVNFAARPKAGAYLQPISGYVLAPFENGYLPAYLACALAADGDMVAEFLVPRYVEAIGWLARRYQFDAETAPFPKLRSVIPAYTRVYDWMRKVSGELRFYVYTGGVPA